MPKAGLTLRSLSSCFANQLQLSGRRNSIKLQMLSSATENKSASVSADGTQNIPPSAIPSRCRQCFPTMNKLLTAIIVIGLTACKQPKSKSDTKTMDFGAFTIETPQSWQQIKESGTDSYVGRIAIDEKDTLSFDLGWYSNTLTESDPVIMDRSMLQHFERIGQPLDTSEMIIVESRKGIDPDNYKKQKVAWDTIDSRRAKIVYPRKSGSGITGVYIDSLWVSGSDVDHFNLYGDNLKPENEKKVLQALQTLKFKKK